MPIDGQNIILLPHVKPVTKQEGYGDLSEKIWYFCKFCEKKIGLYPTARRFAEKLSGKNQFYCPFCLRNGFNDHKKASDTLILSFRQIFGYYYYDKYTQTVHRKKWVEQIRKYIEMHKQIGLQNPLFVYDEDTMLWFLNFAKISEKKQPRRLSLNDIVMKTITPMIKCLEIESHYPKLNMEEFFQKFSQAVVKFCETRTRPEGMRMLMPTFKNCGVDENKEYTFEDSKLFVI